MILAIETSTQSKKEFVESKIYIINEKLMILIRVRHSVREFY